MGKRSSDWQTRHWPLPFDEKSFAQMTKDEKLALLLRQAKMIKEELYFDRNLDLEKNEYKVKLETH